MLTQRRMERIGRLVAQLRKEMHAIPGVRSLNVLDKTAYVFFDTPSQLSAAAPQLSLVVGLPFHFEGETRRLLSYFDSAHRVEYSAHAPAVAVEAVLEARKSTGMPVLESSLP